MKFIKFFLLFIAFTQFKISWAQSLNDIQGMWYKPCANGAELKIQIFGHKITRTKFLWSDSNCFRRSQTWEEVGTIESSSNNPNQFFVTWTSLIINPYKIAIAEQFNLNFVCQANDWVAGDSKNRIVACLGQTEISEEIFMQKNSNTLTINSFGLDIFSFEDWKKELSPFILTKI